MIEKTTFHGWNAFNLSAGRARLTLPVEVGPRVLSCTLGESANLFALLPDQLGGRGEKDWCIRGGHRFWHSPEHPERTYAPDNEPVAVEQTANGRGLSLRQGIETGTGMAKTLVVEAIGDETFRVTHTLASDGLWPVECSAWALSVMRTGGYAVVPFLPLGQHPRDLLPAAAIVPWTYTDFSLPCWQFRTGRLGIDTTQGRVPQKVGLTAYPGWAAYWLDGVTFVKCAALQAGARYPDLGCAFETFCCDWMIELETLSPLRVLNPGESLTHVEYWGVLGGLPKPDSETAYRDEFLPAITAWVKKVSA